MNQIKKITFLFISAILFVTACKKEEETNKTEESYYKTELERIAHFKSISKTSKPQDPTNTLNFKSYKEAYDFFSALKKGVSVTDTIKGKAVNESGIKSLNLSRLNAKNRTSNWGDPLIEEVSYSGYMQITSGIGGSGLPVYTLGCAFDYGFTIRYTNSADGSGLWHGEILLYHNMGQPSFHFSGLGTITHNSASRWQINKNESVIDGVATIKGDPVSFFIIAKITITPTPAPSPDGTVVTSGHMTAIGY